MPKFKILSNLVRTAMKPTTTASDTTFNSFFTILESITPPKPKTSSKSEKQPKTKTKTQPQPPPPPAVKSSFPALRLEDFYSEDSETNPTAKDIAKIKAKTTKDMAKIINVMCLLFLLH